MDHALSTPRPARPSSTGRRAPGWGPGTLAVLTTVLLVGLSVAPTLASGPGTTISWGNNDRGQLGGGPGPAATAPGTDSGLVGVKAVAAGGAHTLALMADGSVRAWGANDRGQLGNGTTDDSATPVVVSGLSNVAAIAAGGSHSLALGQDGRVYAWGEGAYGQLGNGYPPSTYSEDAAVDCFLVIVRCTLEPSGTAPDMPSFLTTPEAVIGLRNVQAIAAGASHSLAVRTDGSVWAWGLNDQGQLGAGPVALLNGPILPVPVPVGGNSTREDRLGGIVAVAAGGRHSLALGADGSVFAWGSNALGQLGDGADVEPGCACRSAPGAVPSVGSATALAAGESHSLAIAGDRVVAWGDNSRGQLGDGTTENRAAPTLVLAVPGGGGGLGGSVPVAIAAGGAHSVAVLDAVPVGECGSLASRCAGPVYTWGAGDMGQLGDGGTGDRPLPARLQTILEVDGVAAGGGHTVTLDGKVGLRPIFPTEPTPGPAIVATVGTRLLPPGVRVAPTSTPPPAPLAPFRPFATPTRTP